MRELRRKFYDDLVNWKRTHHQECLLVKGARQIGKTYIIEKFGRENYESLLTFNFILEPDAAELFEGSLKAEDLYKKISAYDATKQLIPGRTLIFLDEIQECANARTALITRGLAEMSRLGAALGADPATFMGMAGLGDLVLTCTDNQSRNRRFGMMLGQGMDVQSAQEKIGQVVEGYRNTKEVRELAHRFGVEMPITEEIYQVLYCGKNAREAALTLLGRARKDERSSH